MQRYQPYINGDFVGSEDDEQLPIYDPSTEEVIATVPNCCKADVDRAVRAARTAFEGEAWRNLSARGRGRLLFELARFVRSHASEFAELESRNTGKPIVEAEFDVEDAATCFEYYGGLANKILGTVNPVPDNALSLTLREPVGVVGQIIPWNYPLVLAAWKLAPALSAGCTCILKPAEQTPLTVLELARSVSQIGFPAGVINVLTGSGEKTGAAVASHADVDKISFTGSVAVGKSILKAGVDPIKKVTLELGGKSPNIFFEDADFEAAIDGALFGVFINQGEVCSAGSRILVQRPIYAKFVEAMVEKTKTIRLGPPLDRRTRMGPLISKQQYDRVRDFQESGKREAKLMIGGGRPVSIKRGFYVEPTIFADAPNGSRIGQEEIFGPVAAIMPFDREDEAIRIANDTIYGLAAAAWTRDIFKAIRMTKALRCGVVWINCTQVANVEAPWGGYKQSGFGRELGPCGVDEYLESKQVHFNLGEQPIAWY
jgi:betaine-aldehyde dehydrogenase